MLQNLHQLLFLDQIRAYIVTNKTCQRVGKKEAGIMWVRTMDLSRVWWGIPLSQHSSKCRGRQGCVRPFLKQTNKQGNKQYHISPTVILIALIVSSQMFWGSMLILVESFTFLSRKRIFFILI